MFASLLLDVRCALRQMRKAPRFAAIAVTVQALGLGANIVAFTLIDGIFLRPQPFPQADRIVEIEGPTSFRFGDDMQVWGWAATPAGAGDVLTERGRLSEALYARLPQGVSAEPLAAIEAGSIEPVQALRSE